jgi:hypothetical protein
MDEMTQQNAALVEQAAAAAESMQEQAQKLAQAVSIFKLNGDDEKRARRAPLRAAPARPAARAPLARAQAPVAAVEAPKPAPAKPKKVAASDDWEEF